MSRSVTCVRLSLTLGSCALALVMLACPRALAQRTSSLSYRKPAHAVHGNLLSLRAGKRRVF